jgi:hypothetical protein
MDVRINEVSSTIRTVDSKSMVDPKVMREIVRACLKAVKENETRQKQLAADRKMTSGASAEDR